jgi:hypothetical protein
MVTALTDLQRLAILCHSLVYFVPLEELIALFPESRSTNFAWPPFFGQSFHQYVRFYHATIRDLLTTLPTAS